MAVAAVVGGGNSSRGSADADLDRVCDRLVGMISPADFWPANFWFADVCSGERVEVSGENARPDGSGASWPLSILGRKGLAEAIITFDGAGAGTLRVTSRAAWRHHCLRVAHD